ncbi:MAG: prolipoprotein diacylglyceryl transferase [Verrucomicrobiota bacterium]|nr:prolipoprotein diacylglyceryl transferase [Verrucomicrobiota bacterium]
MHPVAFDISGLTVHWYGILLATGFMVGMWTAGRRGMKIGLSPEDISNLMLWIFIGGIAGAKLLYVANHWSGEEPIKNLILQRSGMVFHGALFGTAIAVWLFTRKTKMPLWATLDTLAPSFALGHAFGRIGCFMTGCCYGRICDLPWAVQFPQSHSTHPSHIHPTQIYESLLNLVLYGALAWLFRNRKFNGQIFASYLIGYALLRFGMEFLRADGRGHLWFGKLTSGQGISIILIIGGVMIWRFPSGREKLSMESPE